MGEAWVEHRPVGVLMAVEPWNFPIYQLIRVIGPAIAVGNPVLFKHAGIVPQCAAAFETLVRDAGAPEGACTNLYIDSDTVAELIGDERIQGVALTGSEGAGSVGGARASEMLKKSTLELGGSDVFVVLDDADIEKAAREGAAARLSNAGQACTAAKRFVVQAAVADAFTEAFTREIKGYVLGDATDPSTTLAPMSSQSAVDDLSKQVTEAVDKGGPAPVRRQTGRPPRLLLRARRSHGHYPGKPGLCPGTVWPGRPALRRGRR
jgi:succinate-semialdehyde dehydrogenase/glutarate-semialdehyde dehydrogenase